MNLSILIHQLVASRIARFLLGGGVTVTCEYLIFYGLFVLLHWNLLLANSLSFGVGLGVSFIFNRMWAFKQASFRRKAHHQAMLYIILAVTNLVLNNMIVAGLQFIAVDPRIGKFVAIICIAAWNFIIYTKIIFIGGALPLEQKRGQTAVRFY